MRDYGRGDVAGARSRAHQNVLGCDAARGLERPLLRSDLHNLLDEGYLTIDPQDRRIVVRRRIKEEFENGKDYYKLEARSYGSQQSLGKTHGREFGVPDNR